VIKMVKARRIGKASILHFLRIESKGEAEKTLIGALLGAVFYISLYSLELPSFRAMGYVTVQIDPAILAIPVAAAFFGPLAGLMAGLLGSFGVDAFFTQQVIAMGLINFSFAALGFVSGIPRYPRGFSTWRALAKVVLFTMAGSAVMAAIYLVALISVANQNMLVTLLYNYLPFLTPALITLLLLTPVAVRILEILARQALGRPVPKGPS
jgi:hypothetical protein